MKKVNDKSGNLVGQQASENLIYNYLLAVLVYIQTNSYSNIHGLRFLHKHQFLYKIFKMLIDENAFYLLSKRVWKTD